MYLGHDRKITKYTVGGVFPILGLTTKGLIHCPKDFSEALLLTQMLLVGCLSANEHGEEKKL